MFRGLELINPIQTGLFWSFLDWGGGGGGVKSWIFELCQNAVKLIFCFKFVE